MLNKDDLSSSTMKVSCNEKINWFVRDPVVSEPAFTLCCRATFMAPLTL